MLASHVINMASRQASRTSEPATIRQMSIAKFARANPLRGCVGQRPFCGPSPLSPGGSKSRRFKNLMRQLLLKPAVLSLKS